MKTLFYSPKFPNVTVMELDHYQEMDEYLLRRELKRLISMEKPQVAINQAMDYLFTMPEMPFDKDELLNLMMQTDEIYELLVETKGMMIPATEEMILEYEEKTLLSFLEDLKNWVVTK
jgi:transcriptional antiterminator